MKVELLREMDGPSERLKAARGDARGIPLAERTVKVPAGTVIDHPDAHWLVRMGVARPVDAEAKAAAPLTDAQIAKLSDKYDLLDEGRATGDPKYDRPRKSR